MYLVTGATGNVGSEIVERLLQRNEEVRVFTRNPIKLGTLGSRVQVSTGDFAEPETFAAAAAGVKAVFLTNGACTRSRRAVSAP
jgi:uncharacterized protein YbjT (DUF2867 family)